MSRWVGLLWLGVGVVACANAGSGTLPDEDAGDGGNGGGNIGKACVKNDDCVPPGNLCEGNNGVECKNGFCIATGLPANCNDGVSCTEDSCDANKGKCLHKINDTLCPAMSYCDPTLNCVQSLPCMPGDSVCDRLNIDQCDGQWTCDANKKLCVKGMKPCPDRANATTTCMGMGPMCSWTCKMGFLDSNGDLNVPANQMSNGCECTQMMGPDKPDMQFLDTNCDGIDGDETKAVFVDQSTGSDQNPGTKASPKKTIGAGITTANAANPKKDVYVGKGNYSEVVTMADGVSIYGGYDASASWSRSTMNVSNINPASPSSLVANNLSQAVEIQLFTVTSQGASGTNGNGDGKSSTAITIVGCSGGVTVRGCTISAGGGANASNGGKGSKGADGTKGGDASGINKGGQGASQCGAPGGQGGQGVGCTGPGNPGTAGTTAANGGAGANPGSGGATGTCSGTSSSDGGGAAPVQANGGQGNPGSNGNAGPNLGALDSQGNYLTAAGGGGIASGYPGGGGGGGGSGGGTAHGTPGSFCTNCSCISSGGGGGGGGGGCGGGPGAGGRGGGGSFAIAIVSSTVTVDATKMTTSNGGNGGNGGDGGDGGSGGGVGAGAGGGSDSNLCSTRSAGTGAAGSSGGAGGNGGAGAGGTGGASVCIIYKGSAPTTMMTMCTNGGAGSSGNGGTNGVQQAPSGTQGVTGDLKASN